MTDEFIRASDIEVELGGVIACGGSPPLTLDDYQDAAAGTAIYNRDAAVVYPALGLVGETAELCDKLLGGLFPDGVADGDVADELLTIFSRIAYWGSRAEKLKKFIRGKDAPVEAVAELRRRVRSLPPELLPDLVKEQGDTLWYEAALARDLGVRLSEVARGNLDKLADRKSRGVLHGSGDNR